MKINRNLSIISRLPDQIETSNLPTIDCFLPDQDRLSSIYGSAINSYSKCCSICQKGKLYAIELSNCKHKYYQEPILNEVFNECCYSRLYQTRQTLNPSISSSIIQDYSLNNDYKSWPAQLGTSNSVLDSLINNGLSNVGLINNGLSKSLTNNILSTIGLTNNGQTNNQQINQRMLQSNHRTSNPNLNSNLQQQLNNMILTHPNTIDRSLIGRSSVERTTNEIYQQLQLNVDIEKIYLSKARLMLSLKKNETLITNLTDQEKGLLFKALDTTKLDYTIKHLTNLVQNGTFNSININEISGLSSLYSSGVQSSMNSIAHSQSSANQQSTNNSIRNDFQFNEFANHPLTASSNLIDQLQLLLATNGTVDHYSNLPISLNENINSSTLSDDDLDTSVYDDIN